MLQLLHLSNVQRWVVAPMLRPQSVAEHTFRVVCIGLEMCSRLGLPESKRNTLVHHALVHDEEEMLTGDTPGNAKDSRPGYLAPVSTMMEIQCIIKVADSIESGTWWAMWGNPTAWTGHPYLAQAGPRDAKKIRHYATKMDGLVEVAATIWEEICGQEMP